jgi:hypothetical protein
MRTAYPAESLEFYQKDAAQKGAVFDIEVALRV